MPQQVLNWWDMKPFDVSNFLWLARNFQELSSKTDPQRSETVEERSRSRVAEMFADSADECEEMGLTSTADQFRRIANVSKTAIRYGEISDLLPEALNRLEDECKRKIVLAIESDYVKYFSDAQFFDPKDSTADKVSVQFPSAADDIAEAGKCLACGRSTACVMHLNRIMEAGLKALAAALSIGPQNDWGKYLTKIDDDLRARIKTSGARSHDEQFYAEAHAIFDSVRRAWRNPTMHVEKTYTDEHAEEILIAVRSFMRHLATKLHD